MLRKPHDELKTAFDGILNISCFQLSIFFIVNKHSYVFFLINRSQEYKNCSIELKPLALLEQSDVSVLYTNCKRCIPHINHNIKEILLKFILLYTPSQDYVVHVTPEQHAIM